MSKDALLEGKELVDDGSVAPYHFAKRNELWKLAQNYMRKDRRYEADTLMMKILQYFVWADDNPLIENKLVTYEGVSNLEEIPKLRATTITGCCLFLGIPDKTWRDWRQERMDLSPVLRFAESWMYQRKFDGAAAGLLNPMIISRDLGLAEKTEVTGKGGAPIETVDFSKISIEAMRELLSARNVTEGET